MCQQNLKLESQPKQKSGTALLVNYKFITNLDCEGKAY